MIIDESENLSVKSDEYLAYRQVLLSGYASSGMVNRTSPDGMTIDSFLAYNPKIIISIGQLEDTLDDRAFETILLKSTNKTVMDREVSSWERDPEQWQGIIDDLYLLLMERWKEVQNIHNNLQNENGFPGRFWNLSKPLLSIARFIDGYAPEGTPKIESRLVSFLKTQAQKKAELQGDVGAVLQALYELLRGTTGQKIIKLGDVRHKIIIMEGPVEEWEEKRVSGVLRNLHLYNKAKRKGKGYHFSAGLEEVQAIATRCGYQLSDPDENNEPNEGHEREPVGQETLHRGH